MPNLNMCVRVCIDLKIFALTAGSNGPMTAEQLAQVTGAEQLLVGLNFAHEVDVNTYSANAVTKAIASPAMAAGFALE
ncbi:hypothetical protein B0A49_09091 [Cryomyces minteri]|uniref:Uncharacterized protein n=1 Tax=Cryomyces minteri TaxID=331657 RepID=A0A4V5NEQ4_9PEZI|nr:hypothetical protein B0A49_09091 [Cryomyces minteri]